MWFALSAFQKEGRAIGLRIYYEFSFEGTGADLRAALDRARARCASLPDVKISPVYELPRLGESQKPSSNVEVAKSDFSKCIDELTFHVRLGCCPRIAADVADHDGAGSASGTGKLCPPRGKTAARRRKSH